MIKTGKQENERTEFYNELLKDKTDIFTEFGKEMYSSIYVEGYPLYKMVVFFNNKTKQVTKKGIGGETFALVEFSPNNYKSIRDLYAKASFEKEYIPKLIKEIIIKIKNKCKKEFKIVFSLDDEEQRFNITKHWLLSSGYFLAKDFLKKRGLEAVVTLSTKEIGKYALNGIFCYKEFLEASIRLKIGATLR